MEAASRIRREAEERSVAHQDLASWMDSLQTKPRVEKTKPSKPKGTNNASHPQQLTHPLSCEEERVAGNAFFAQGKYEDAVQCYTRCLSKSDALASPLVYSNRGEQTSVRCVCSVKAYSLAFLFFP